MALSLVPPRPSPAFRIAVTNVRTGSGQSGVAINLAAALSRLGRRVSLFDADLAAAAALSSSQWARIGVALSGASANREFVVVDTATLANDTVIDLIGHADRALLVTTCEPAALVEALALVRRLTAADADTPIGVLIDAAPDERHAEWAFRHLSRAADRFLGRTLQYDGSIVEFAADRSFARLAARLASYRHPLTPGPGPAAVVRVLRPQFAALTEAPRCA